MALLLIVMYETSTWRVRPGDKFTFGRASECSLALPAEDRGVSRNAGSFECAGDYWWLSNDSASSMLFLQGDRGLRVDMPPGMRMPLQQWHAKVRVDGVFDRYTIRLRLPHLDEEDPDDEFGEAGQGTADEDTGAEIAPEPVVTSTRLKAPLNDTDRLVLAARFEEYLTWRHSGAAQPRSAKDTADRIGWQPHTVTKRCENIRNRYVRIGVPGLRGPRALEELAGLLISTGELSADDLKRLPPRPPEAGTGDATPGRSG